jgi:hypothetical protein
MAALSLLQSWEADMTNMGNVAMRRDADRGREAARG